jgi:hypothetical protein
MAEIIENVKSNMVIRGDNTVQATHFLVCVKSYLRQVELAKTKDMSVTPEKALATALIQVIHNDEFFEKVEEAAQKVWDNN